MRNIDYYELLGIPRDATPEEITRGYRERAKEYHPDRVAHLGEELQFHAKRRYLLIDEARKTLLDRERRTRYDAHLELLRASFVRVTCPACGAVDQLPRQLRPGTIRCRSCSGDLGVSASASNPVSPEGLVPLFTAALLTLRNISYAKSVDLSLVLDFEGIQLEVRNALEGERTQSAELYGVVNSRVLHELLSNKLGYESEPWDALFSSGWIFFPRGDDKELATNLTSLLGEYIQLNGEVSVRFTTGETRGGWDHWAGVFLLTSLHDISPWRAAKQLEKSGGELLSVTKGMVHHDGILENLKYNWKIFLMVSSLSREQHSLSQLEHELNTIQNALNRAQRHLGS